MAAQAWPAVKMESERGSSIQRCPKHRTTLVVVRVSRRAPAGLWCNEGHAPRLWDIIDTLTGRLMTRGSINGPVPLGPSRPVDVWLSGRSCLCARCGHAWFSVCECAAKESASQLAEVAHVAGCEPPRNCANCRAVNWQQPSR